VPEAIEPKFAFPVTFKLVFVAFVILEFVPIMFARLAVPVAVMLVPVALSNIKFEMNDVIELKMLAKRLLDVALVFTRFVVVALVARKSTKVDVVAVTESKIGLDVKE
jgi:hypothetical protein